MKTKTVAQTGVLIALALVLSYVESLFPAFTSVPGVRIGLANIAVVFALYRLGFANAMGISLTRVVISSLLFGSVLSMVYSAAGAIISLIVMALLKKTGLFSPVAVSVAGGVSHNLGQIGVACLILQTSALVYYVPALIICGVVAGVVIGFIAAVVLDRVNGDEDGRKG